MKRMIIILSFALAFTGSAASAACVAEYKAKRDNPLRLNHGEVVVTAGLCTKQAVEPAVRAELARRGWTLLSIVSVRQSG